MDWVRCKGPRHLLELLNGKPQAARHVAHVAQGRQPDAVQVRRISFAFPFPQPAGQCRDLRLKAFTAALKRIFLTPIAEPLRQSRRLVRREDDHGHRRQMLQGVEPDRLDRQGHAITLVDHQDSPSQSAERPVAEQVQNPPHAPGCLEPGRNLEHACQLGLLDGAAEVVRQGLGRTRLAEAVVAVEQNRAGIRGGDESLELANKATPTKSMCIVLFCWPKLPFRLVANEQSIR
jgi:hypothetical protein